MQYDLDRIDDCFPKAEFREGQKKAIEFACKQFNEGKKVVILECPTGSGKSAIGMTMANMAENSYYLTITKILQDQFMNDFGDKVVELKGRNAYPCDYYERNREKLAKIIPIDKLDEKIGEKPDCASGYCKSKIGRKDGHKCSGCFLRDQIPGVPKGDLNRLPDGKSYSACAYYEQVFKSVNNPVVCMNFNSFIYQTMMTRRFDMPRDLLIIDEGHNIEQVLLDVVSFVFASDTFKDFGIILPKYEDPRDYFDWCKEERIAEVIALAIEDAKRKEDHKTEDDLSKLVKRVIQFLETFEKSEWVCQTTYAERSKEFSVEFKPVFIRDYADKMLFRFADKVLIMSATILDINVFCNALGLEKDQIASYRMKNRFPVENRPIYFKDCGNLTGGKGRMNEWMPKVIDVVDEICERYPDERGMIHTHNFAILDALVDGCQNRHRFITQRMHPDKKELLELHARKPGSILVAPAMHEGVDLNGDLSRFQIISKVPFPNFFDNKQLNRRNQVDPAYIPWLTALKLVQSYGRSIRGPEDYADTYIIDGSFVGFIKRSGRLFPSWFMDALQDGDKNESRS